eukprot:SAG31_NODE_3520_length_4165_cov_1.856370_2_plen_289_part_00
MFAARIVIKRGGSLQTGLDECCRPIDFAGGVIVASRLAFLTEAVVEIEAVAPDVVDRILERYAAAAGYKVDETSVMSTRSGTLRWTTYDPDVFVRVHDQHDQAIHSAAACTIKAMDIYTALSRPCASIPRLFLVCTKCPHLHCTHIGVRADCSEMPEAIANFIAADPTASLACRFRRHAQLTLVPHMRHISELLKAHVAVVQLPPTAWLTEKFPVELWRLNTARLFYDFWVSRTSAWEELLAEWESGVLDALVPRGNNWFPLRGLRAVNDWSIAKAEMVQLDLIGVRH